MRTVFQCEGSVDGIFTGVYEAWASRLGHDRVKVEVLGERNLELFSRYVHVETDHGKAEKVAKALRNRLSGEDYRHIYQACLCADWDRADEIYRVIVLGLSGRGERHIMERLQDAHVCRVFEMSRKVGNEGHRYLGFLRFRELKSEILFSEIHPENQVLPLIGDHFSDRYPRENFLIYDGSHETFLVHRAGKSWFLAFSSEWSEQETRILSGKEEEFQELWQAFCTAIAIEERKNPCLQRQLLPLKFRSYMTEKYK